MDNIGSHHNRRVEIVTSSGAIKQIVPVIPQQQLRMFNKNQGRDEESREYPLFVNQQKKLVSPKNSKQALLKEIAAAADSLGTQEKRNKKVKTHDTSNLKLVDSTNNPSTQPPTIQDYQIQRDQKIAATTQLMAQHQVVIAAQDGAGGQSAMKKMANKRNSFMSNDFQQQNVDSKNSDFKYNAAYQQSRSPNKNQQNYQSQQQQYLNNSPSKKQLMDQKASRIEGGGNVIKHGGSGQGAPEQLVEASVLFTSKQDQSNPINFPAQRKQTLPNLNLPRFNSKDQQNYNLRNSNNSGSHLSPKHSEQIEESKKQQSKLQVQRRKGKKKPYSMVEEINLVKGLQNHPSDLNSARDRLTEISVKKNDKKFQYRKSSHAQPVRDFQLNQIVGMHGKVQQQSYGQLPQLPAIISPNRSQMQEGQILSGRPEINRNIMGAGSGATMIPISASQASMMMKNKQERLALAASGLEKDFHIQPFQPPISHFKHSHHQQQIQANDLHVNQFQQWSKMPNLEMHGRGVDQLKQFSIETLQKIRAQAVLAPSSITTVAQNQFQPIFQTLQSGAALRNSPLGGGLGKAQSLSNINATRNMDHTAQMIAYDQIRKRGSSMMQSSPINIENFYTPEIQRRIEEYQFNIINNTPQGIRQQHQNIDQTMLHTSIMQQHLQGYYDQGEDLRQQLHQHQKYKLGTVKLMDGDSRSSTNQSGVQQHQNNNNSSRNSSYSQMRQEEQIKFAVKGISQLAIREVDKIIVPMDKRSTEAHNKKALVSKSQLNSLNIASAADEDAVASQGEGGDQASANISSPTHKDINRKVNGKGTNSKEAKKTGEKHVRQFSQAQRQNRNSLIGGGKQNGRQMNSGKDGASNHRQVVMNSPLMQPPPQILQSKIIINLLRTEYPLIEQVAKGEMAWRVTKSENPNAEFDVYWNDIGIDSERLATLKPYQKTNHFPAMFQITRKTFLAKNLKRLQKLYPLEFDFFPKTWVLPNELNELRTYSTQKARKPKAVSAQKLPTRDANLVVATPSVTNGQQTADHLNLPGSRVGHNEPAKNSIVPSQQALPSSSPAKAAASHAAEEDSSELDGEDDERDSQDEDSGADSIADTSKENQAAAGAMTTTIGNFGVARRLGQKEQRKAPLARTRGNKSRFPMIVKPDCSSQGKGIFLTNDIDQIPKDDIYVVQQYMQNPYLLDGLKFDLRLYVLVLSCEPLKIFLYQEGLVRFATHKYKPIEPNADKNALNNLYMHLTNYAVNKENENFKPATSMNDETAHKRTLKTVLDRLKTEGLDPDKIMGEIKDVIVKTLITIQQELAHNYRTCQPADLESLMCFEILGFDIILDSVGKPVLLEVNQAPSFATDSPLDYEIKKGLFVDTFRLLGLSVEKKKAKVRRLYEEKKERMMTKLTLKQKNIQRRKAIDEFKKEQDVYEKANNGRFEKIYPLPVKDAAESNSLTQDDPTLSQTQKQLAQSQYQALARQQERYNQLLATVGNSDVEKAIRAKIRQDDQKCKEDKSKETKLRLKRQEKRRTETLVDKARQFSQQQALQRKLQGTADNFTAGLIRPDGSVEQAMRESIVKSPGDIQQTDQTPSYDSKLRQSISDRIQSETRSVQAAAQQQYQQQLKSREVNNYTMNGRSVQPPIQANYALTQSFALKHPSQLNSNSKNVSINDQRMRDSLNNNGVLLDQNLHLRTLIEMQQKLAQAQGVNTPQKHANFNLFANMQQQVQLNHNGSHSYNTGRSGHAYKHNNGVTNQMIEGLKPNITQLTYHHNQVNTSISQSQNPINPKKLRTGEYDMKMSRTVGRQANNLLPNIAKNMIQAEKSSQGFTNQQMLAMAQQQQQQEVNNNVRGNSKGMRFRDSQNGAASSTSNQSKQQTTVEATVANGQQQNASPAVVNSPQRQERANFQRCSIQQTSGNTPNSNANSQQKPTHAIKTQQMNLGTMNIQPVIIDSSHFNNVEKQQQMSPGKNVLVGQGISYKTQKFSKIQLQAIIDNLYQYESKGQKQQQPSQNGQPQQQSQVRSAQEVMNDLSQTTNFKNGIISPNMTMYLPTVNPSENINKTNNLANRALNVIAQQKASASAAIQANMIGMPSDVRSNNLQVNSLTGMSTPLRIRSSGQHHQQQTLTSPPLSSQQQELQQQKHLITDGHGRFQTHRSNMQQTGIGVQGTNTISSQQDHHSSPAKKHLMSPKKSTGGAFAIHGQSFQAASERQQTNTHNHNNNTTTTTTNGNNLNNGAAPSSPTAATATTTNVLNFNNCNVTIINNNGNSNIFEGNPSGAQGAASTIIQSSLISRPLQSSPTASKVGHKMTGPSPAQHIKFTQNHEVNIASPKMEKVSGQENQLQMAPTTEIVGASKGDQN